ncbi:MAG: hypothetical protein ACE5GZ_00795 [Gammaproteobacteria bacterium]
MNEKIRELLAQITALEDEIEEVLLTQQEQFLYHLKDGRIRFKQGIEEAHRELKKGLLRWALDSRPRNMLSAPFIYAMIVPFALLDLCLTLYQWLCFPLYRIGKVKRNAYIVIDRHHLKHLNSIERFNCIYCGYANGLLAYAREVAARTEQYWCPIKHARRVLDRHSRYHDFIDFGVGAEYHARLNDYRSQLQSETLHDEQADR